MTLDCRSTSNERKCAINFRSTGPDALLYDAKVGDPAGNDSMKHMVAWLDDLDLHPLDWVVLLAYFVVVTFLGVVVGKRKTKNLGDFFVAGGRWGSLVVFVFVFASAVGGAEAVVVAGATYEGGISGVWYW